MRMTSCKTLNNFWKKKEKKGQQISIVNTLSQDVYYVYAAQFPKLFNFNKYMYLRVLNNPHFSFEMSPLSCWVKECS